MIQSNDHYAQAASLDLTRIDPQVATLALLTVVVVVALALRPMIPNLPRWFLAQVLRLPRSPAPARDTDARLAAVSALPFEPISILKREEAILMPVLEQAARQAGLGHRVLAQASLGDLICPCEAAGTLPQRQAAAAAIRDQRLDFALIDRRGRLVVAVAYHGSGHYLSDAYLEDRIKMQAVIQAGIACLEVPQGFDATDLLRRLKALLSPAPDRDLGAPRVIPFTARV